MNADVTIRSTDGAELASDYAIGNTARSALAAGHALARSLALELSEERGEAINYTVKVGAVSEMRQVAICDGHPAGPGDPMGQTVYCEGTCQA